MRDYYHVLGIKPDATMGEVQSAYKRLSLKYHPDKNPERNTTREFQEISEAYQVLGDYHKRRAYDNDREMFQLQEMTDPFDMFESFNRNFSKHFQNMINIDFQMPDFMANMPNIETRGPGNFYSYSSSSTTNFDPDKGGYQTRRTTSVNQNGQKQNLVENIMQDKEGRVLKHTRSYPKAISSREQKPALTYAQSRMAMGPRTNNPKYPVKGRLTNHSSNKSTKPVKKPGIINKKPVRNTRLIGENRGRNDDSKNSSSYRAAMAHYLNKH